MTKLPSMATPETHRPNDFKSSSSSLDFEQSIANIDFVLLSKIGITCVIMGAGAFPAAGIHIIQKQKLDTIYICTSLMIGVQKSESPFLNFVPRKNIF